ncbi:ROK family protein [Natronorarus salvus]|uniref:ROK family protein n=1 Tax=Natronorarus salvus TaxID=3117733 RepID=UPI002F26CC02
MAPPRFVAVDVGSTHTKTVVSTLDGEFTTSVAREPTRPEELGSEVVRAVRRRLCETNGAGLEGIGVATTGLVDRVTGTIREFDTADGRTLRDIPLGDRLREAFGVPVAVENDCTAAALGEWYFGAREREGCLVHVTFATGIGAGVVADGVPLRGEHGHAAEVGLFPIHADGELESCGVTGAWEAYCSGRGIPRFVESRLGGESETTLATHGTLTAREVFEAAAAGDERAIESLDLIGRYNAAGIGAIANAYDPGLVTLGGSVALENPEAVLGGIDRYLDEFCYGERPRITTTPLGAEIELYGALASYLHRERAPETDRTERVRG